MLDKEQYRTIQTDSREIQAGEIFMAIQGSNFDGHEFIDQALHKGASMVFSQLPHQNSKVIKVDDTLVQYHKLANEYRNLINPIVIGITGSAGKTTTKELLASILKQKFRVHYTQANFNNEIGVPKTILSMPTDTEVLILEMGMRGLGEIELLSKTAEPNIALITSIGTAHIERLGSIANIRKAKLEIIRGLKSHNSQLTTSLYVDEKLYQELNGDEASSIIKFHRTSSPEPRVENPKYLISQGLLASIDACSKIAQQLGLNQEQIKTGIENFSPGKGRGEFIHHGNNIYIDETYNSNPEALLNSARALIENFPEQHKIIVAGDIKESEPDLIDKAFAQLQELDLTVIDARNLDHQATTKLITAKLQDNERNIVLIKASRSAKFEEVLNLLLSPSSAT